MSPYFGVNHVYSIDMAGDVYDRENKSIDCR